MGTRVLARLLGNRPYDVRMVAASGRRLGREWNRKGAEELSGTMGCATSCSGRSVGTSVKLIPSSVPRTEHFIVCNGHKKSSQRTFCFGALRGVRMVTGAKLPRLSELGPRRT